MTGLLFPIALLAVFVYAAWWDIRLRIIPDRVHVALLLVAAARVLAGELAPLSTVAGLLAAGLPLLVAAVLLGGIGGGDVKLAGAAGAVLGFPAALPGLVLALALTTVLGGIWLAVGKSNTKSLPCAPFFGAGFFIVYMIAGGL